MIQPEPVILNHGGEDDAEHDLIEALTMPRARNSDPQTSKSAAASVVPGVNRLENIVYEAIHIMGKEGATGAEVEKITGLPWQTLSPRFAPLRRKGLIRANGTRPGRSNRAQIVWVANALTPAEELGTHPTALAQGTAGVL